MEEEKNEEKIKRNLKKIVIIVLSVLILLDMVAVGIWYFIFKNKGIQDLKNKATEENMQDFKVPVITGIKDIEIVEGEALNFINDIIVTENEQKQEENEESRKENEETKKENKKENAETKKQNKENIKENKETKKGNKTETTTNKKETTNNTIKAESQENKSNIATQKPKLIGTDTQRKLTNTKTKYGVVINTYSTITYNIYSDGSKTIKSTENSTEYDRSHYSATTAELLPEAKNARSKYANMIRKIIKNTNSYRQEANINAVENVTNRPDLDLNDQLCVAACVRAVEMAYANKYSHTRPDGRKCFTVASELRVSAIAENIACGYDGADSVSLCWKYSKAHYINMINSYYTEIGIGVFELDGVYYWVQLFS